MRKINKFSSIRNNMIVYTLSIIFLMTVLSIYSLTIMERYQGQIEAMFEKHIYLSEVGNLMIELDEDLLGFLSSKSSTRLNDYIINSEKLELLVKDAHEMTYNAEDMMMKNIVNLIDAYVIEADQAITYKRQRNVIKYYEHYQKSVTIKGFIADYIDQLNNRQLNRNSVTYTQLVRQIMILQNITYMIVIVLIGLSLMIVYLITSRMVKPFSHLSHAAEEIALGNFETEDIVVETEDEFLLLATAFNHMKNSIKSYISEIKKNAETEAKLKDEQLKNIKMEHLLDNAKLYALQSQINPHFLFNTINAGVQMSIMERATKTSQFFQTMASLFRYNIQKMDSSCTLEEEIENIKDYYELLKVRFGDRIRFQFNIDSEALDMKVPPLILQPLVENAYVHGLSGLEEGGTITINVIDESDATYITVKDTGKGMTAHVADQILNKERDDYTHTKFGIGIRNVRDRLELFFHQPNLFKIECEEGAGVKIVMKIPHIKE